MVSLKSVGKVYKYKMQEINALKAIDLEVNQGEFWAINGRSGSGKTTMLLTIGAMLQPSYGEVKIRHRNIYTLNDKERTNFRKENIGFIFQMFYLIPYLNVTENIMIHQQLRSDGNYVSAMRSLTEQLGLEHRLLHRPSELSAGEKQRVALARAMLKKPELILADEPTGNLDEENSRQVLQYLQDYTKSGGTVIMVTHDRSANEYATNTMNISN
ncbi:ABC transporter ATP-binding protein [Fulvivirgaceae bacterium BMA12]|uniref:ABC transporter ATP-binding protein n=1 Tax=Agaribacillus aureus TaxID=3051825 RepID=A0ABT8L7C6_9BACT|nr:ABC transporter ATP-binding protein [Fulvivirgaceae bacterium BMA12]